MSWYASHIVWFVIAAWAGSWLLLSFGVWLCDREDRDW